VEKPLDLALYPGDKIPGRYLWDKDRLFLGPYLFWKDSIGIGFGWFPSPKTPAGKGRKSSALLELRKIVSKSSAKCEANSKEEISKGKNETVMGANRRGGFHP